MSYDIALCVRVSGTNVFAKIVEPECANPTYNYRKMFVAAMGWDYELSNDDENTGYYPCIDAVKYLQHGWNELKKNPKKYREYEPDNGWGTYEGAIRVIESILRCIEDTVENLGIPIEHLYMKWG